MESSNLDKKINGEPKNSNESIRKIGDIPIFLEDKRDPSVPSSFNIEDFMPITGKIHQPFNVHQTFEGAGFNVNSFVSRLLDYHPLAIPLPYNHTNVDMDEMTYYVEGQFSGHKGIESGSVTMHPSGIPHGPHSRTIDKSIGKDKTVETAIMVDTAKPLKLTPFSMGLSEDDYAYSWKK